MTGLAINMIEGMIDKAIGVGRSELLLIVFTLAVFTPLEVFVAQEKQAFWCRARGIVYGLLFIPAVIATILFFRWLWPALGVSYSPLITIPAGMEWLGPLAAILSPFVAAMLVDFFFYWGHRAQHRFFWRFHAVHHSIQDLNGINAYHHFTEQFFRMTVFAIPASFVSVEASPTYPVITLLIMLWPAYLHSSTKANLGWLRILVVDNRFHRIHHSLEPQHFDKNFGAWTTIWDRVFGTAYFPAPDEWPAVGLADVDEPRTVRQWLDLPLRYGKRRQAEFEPIAAE